MKLAILAFVSAAVCATTTKEGAGVRNFPREPLKSQILTRHLQYDAISAGPPGLLGGTGVAVSPNPFKSLKYDDKFTVIALGNELIHTLKPASNPNVLVSQSTALGRSFGTISKTSDLASFKATRIYFACAQEFLLETFPVPCNVLFEGTTNSLSGVPRIETANYTGDATMQRVDFEGWDDLRRISFAVRTTGEDGNTEGNVTLLLDSFFYTTYSK